jgi:hypothetical protein
LRREARNFLGYFVWKITILRQKIIYFPILGGGPPPWIRPCVCTENNAYVKHWNCVLHL